MEGSLRELADYRMDRAKEMLHAAEDNLKIGQWKTALNRSYYAIFHAMRAVNILGGVRFFKTLWCYCIFYTELFENKKTRSSIV